MKEPGTFAKAALAALVLLVLAAAAETTARLLPRPRGLPEITAVLRQDPELFWTQKRGLRARFAGAPLRTNSLGWRGGEPAGAGGGPRIVVMGASPAFGWGVDEALTYAALLEKALLAKGVNAQVLNASVIGYSSFQGRKLLAGQVLPLKPDILIFAYGVNDVDKYRFFRDSPLPDARQPLASPAAAAAANLAASSRFIAAYSWLILKLTGADPELYGLRSREFREGRRVEKSDFTANLDAMRALAAGSGARVIFATAPFMTPPGPEEDARALLLAAGQKKGADRVALLKRAKTAELHSCRGAAQDYNAALRALAKQKAVPLADLERLFSGPGGRPDPANFLAPQKDMVHFSPAGHAAAAAQLLGLVEKMIK
ncbi:MAG: SGNH/GDSL hydrolase family protein [Elusimicrobiales bacterium]|nr:SGNH/GDSL hydrolase family protein [Elusimicrobiales bacterium]